MNDKPEWWPENPYPEDVFVMPQEYFEAIVPSPVLRTGIAGLLGREFWDLASDTIRAAMWQAWTKNASPDKPLTKDDLVAIRSRLEYCEEIYYSERTVDDTDLDLDAKADIEALLGEVERQGQELARLARVAECIHCGAILKADDSDLEHWRTCPKHPARAEVERLRTALEVYANEDNWHEWVRQDGRMMFTWNGAVGPREAEDALRGPNA
jgi:hypothetical protein